MCIHINVGQLISGPRFENTELFYGLSNISGKIGHLDSLWCVELGLEMLAGKCSCLPQPQNLYIVGFEFAFTF